MNFTVDELKIMEHYYDAGVRAHELGRPGDYGCHFGMKSTRDRAIEEFNKGWDAAERAALQKEYRMSRAERCQQWGE